MKRSSWIILIGALALVLVVLLDVLSQKNVNNGLYDETFANVQDDSAIKEELPWENDGKMPVEYTWEEFGELSGEQQMAFQKSFGSANAFEAWLQRVHPDETESEETESKTVIPWENGGKQPSEYTWAEFEALSAELQMEFQNSFGSFDAFDKWLQKVHSDDTEPENPEDEVYIPWENGGKQPSEYTWAEFETLSAELQMKFQNSFGSFDAFDKWLQKVHSDDTELENPEDEVYIPWENGGKHPSEYTYEEFEELDAGQQMAFQKSFSSIEEFDEWLQKVKPQ